MLYPSITWPLQIFSSMFVPIQPILYYGSHAHRVNGGIGLASTEGEGRHSADFYLRYAGDIRAGEEGFASYSKFGFLPPTRSSIET
jgi:hypothetical protein